MVLLTPVTRGDLQVDVPGRPDSLHPDQLLLCVRRRAHRRQHLRGGGPGHRSVSDTQPMKVTRAWNWACLSDPPFSAQARASTTSVSFAAEQGRGIAPRPCYPPTSPKPAAPPCASPTVDCSACSCSRACSRSECDVRQQLLLHLCTRVPSYFGFQGQNKDCFYHLTPVLLYENVSGQNNTLTMSLLWKMSVL